MRLMPLQSGICPVICLFEIRIAPLYPDHHVGVALTSELIALSPPPSDAVST
jgi:hypothetical protein